MNQFRVLVVAAATIGVLGGAAPSQAAAIVYTTTSMATGTLGGTPFTDALVTVTLTADTSGVFEPFPVEAPGFLVNFGAATLSILGVGTVTFNDPNGYAAFFFPAGVVAPVPGVAIFELAPDNGGTAIFGMLDASLAGYDLQGAFGPLTGAGAGVATNPDGSAVTFLTTAGALRLTGGGDPVTLTVTVAAVPEPTSLSLLALGGFGALAARRRHRRSRSSSTVRQRA